MNTRNFLKSVGLALFAPMVSWGKVFEGGFEYFKTVVETHKIGDLNYKVSICMRIERGYSIEGFNKKEMVRISKKGYMRSGIATVSEMDMSGLDRRFAKDKAYLYFCQELV